MSLNQIGTTWFSLLNSKSAVALTLALVGAWIAIGGAQSIAFADCASGQTYQYRARATSYYPANTKMEGGYFDRKGRRLHTLQDFLRGDAPFVSVAMDRKAFKYGQKIYIPEMNKTFNKVIVFRVVDTGSKFKNKGRTRIDICTDNLGMSLRPEVNRTVTLTVCK